VTVAVETGWSYHTPTRRYAIGVGRKSTDSRVYPVLLLVLSFVLLLLFFFLDSPWVLIIFVPMGLTGVYNLIRPIGDRMYVELDQSQLVIQVLGRTRIAYDNIETATQIIPTGAARSFQSAAIEWSRLWGGSPPKNPDSRVRLRLKRAVWWSLIPLLRIPRRTVSIPMESPVEFAADVNARIAFATESP
jgi:hypothetical protein